MTDVDNSVNKETTICSQEQQDAQELQLAKDILQRAQHQFAISPSGLSEQQALLLHFSSEIQNAQAQMRSQAVDYESMCREVNRVKADLIAGAADQEHRALSDASSSGIVSLLPALHSIVPGTMSQSNGLASSQQDAAIAQLQAYVNALNAELQSSVLNERKAEERIRQLQDENLQLQAHAARPGQEALVNGEVSSLSGLDLQFVSREIIGLRDQLKQLANHPLHGIDVSELKAMLSRAEGTLGQLCSRIEQAQGAMRQLESNVRHLSAENSHLKQQLEQRKRPHSVAFKSEPGVDSGLAGNHIAHAYPSTSPGLSGPGSFLELMQPNDTAQGITNHHQQQAGGGFVPPPPALHIPSILSHGVPDLNTLSAIIAQAQMASGDGSGADHAAHALLPALHLNSGPGQLSLHQLTGTASYDGNRPSSPASPGLRGGLDPTTLALMCQLQQAQHTQGLYNTPMGLRGVQQSGGGGHNTPGSGGAGGQGAAAGPNTASNSSAERQRAGSPSAAVTGPSKKQRENLPKGAVLILKSWLYEHVTQPYPTEIEKASLAADACLETSQINNWFINARVRIWKPLVACVFAKQEPRLRKLAEEQGDVTLLRRLDDAAESQSAQLALLMHDAEGQACLEADAREAASKEVAMRQTPKQATRVGGAGSRQQEAAAEQHMQQQQQQVQQLQQALVAQQPPHAMTLDLIAAAAQLGVPWPTESEVAGR